MTSFNTENREELNLEPYQANEKGCKEWLSNTEFGFNDTEFNTFYKLWIKLRRGGL